MKRNAASVLATLAAVLLIAGCSGSDDQQPVAPPEPKATTPSQPQIFQDQINALDKARGVEGTVQEGADRQRQQIDDQAR